MIVVAYKEDYDNLVLQSQPYWVYNVKKEGKHLLYLIKAENDTLQWLLASRFETIEKDVSENLLKANKQLMKENKLYRRFLRHKEYFLLPIKIKKPLFLIKIWSKIWAK
jgi:hypothetical protein